jgi:hypothetical protein
LYTIFHDAPRSIPFGQKKPRMSHATDGLIGSINHLNPYGHPSPTCVAHPYPQPYGGISYYPSPTHQQSYPIASPPPMGGPSPVPNMHLISQPSKSSPSTPHITLAVVEILQIPTRHMDHLHKTIHIFYFLVLHNWFLLH